MDIPKSINILKTQIKEVPWEKMHPSFHLNTKFCHLLRAWEQHLPAQETLFQSWTDTASKLIACLPKHYRAIDGETGQEVDPFDNLRKIFASNQQGQSKLIPKYAEQMLSVAGQAGLIYSQQDHENLVELSRSCGIIDQKQETDFFIRRGINQTPREDIEDMIADLEAEQALGQLAMSAAGSHIIATASPQPGGITQIDNKPYLVINGYGGCLCQFPLLIEDDNVVVLQPLEHQGTSVTNLAEVIYQTTQAAFPGKKIFEAYEYDFNRGRDHISEISLSESGHAEWSYSDSLSLRNLVRNQIGQAEIDI